MRGEGRGERGEGRGEREEGRWEREEGRGERKKRKGGVMDHGPTQIVLLAYGMHVHTSYIVRYTSFFVIWRRLSSACTRHPVFPASL